LPYDSLAQLRVALFKDFPHLQRVGEVAPANADDVRKLAVLGGAMDKTPFRCPIEDFYLTNPIARASVVMAECSALAQRTPTPTAADKGAPTWTSAAKFWLPRRVRRPRHL